MSTPRTASHPPALLEQGGAALLGALLCLTLALGIMLGLGLSAL